MAIYLNSRSYFWLLQYSCVSVVSYII